MNSMEIETNYGVMQAVRRMVSTPEYQPKKTGWLKPKYIYYCNVAARDMLDMSYITKPGTLGGLLGYRDYDIKVIAPTVSIRTLIMCTPISTYYDYVENAIRKGDLKRLSKGETRTHVLNGEMVHMVSKALNHEAIVFGVDVEEYDYTVYVAQCGMLCDILPMDSPYAFGSHADPYDVIAIKYPIRKAVK